MILSNRQIREAYKSGHVVIDPYVPDNVRKSSVDVRLGHWFWRCDEKTGLYNPRDDSSVELYFDVRSGPKLAKPYKSVFDKIAPNRPLPEDDTLTFMKKIAPGLMEVPDELKWPEPLEHAQTFAGIKNDWPVIVMRPHETILAHTIEFIGINPPGTSEMRARSTWGRNGLGVCKCAGAGDPGYWNRWTFELTNFNAVPFIIPVGERIAQVIFHATGEVDEGAYGAETGSYTSNYQNSAKLEEVKSRWSPFEMLPKPSKDNLALPEDYPRAFWPSDTPGGWPESNDK